MFFIMDIMQVTYITVPTVDLPTTTGSHQAKTSNVTKHMPTQFQL